MAGVALRLLLRGRQPQTIRFWTRQGLNLSTASLLVLGLLSVWFNDAGRLATGLGILTAGVAFSLQRVNTALARYFIILNGKNCTVGDRIAMGGVGVHSKVGGSTPGRPHCGLGERQRRWRR